MKSVDDEGTHIFSNYLKNPYNNPRLTRVGIIWLSNHTGYLLKPMT